MLFTRLALMVMHAARLFARRTANHIVGYLSYQSRHLIYHKTAGSTQIDFRESRHALCHKIRYAILIMCHHKLTLPDGCQAECRFLIADLTLYKSVMRARFTAHVAIWGQWFLSPSFIADFLCHGRFMLLFRLPLKI